MAAISEGHCKVVNQFLSLCKIPQQELNYGLHTAIEFQHETLVAMLIEAGGDPNFEVQTICRALGTMFKNV